MPIYPSVVRSILTGESFEQSHTGDWCLTLPPYYALLFRDQKPQINRKSKGWYTSKRQSSLRYSYFRDLEIGEINEIRAFIRDFSSYYVIGRSSFIGQTYGEELDACVALGRNFKTINQHTEVGELEYQAKYKNSQSARDQLVERLTGLLNCAKRFCITEQSVISYIPPSPSKAFDLPRYFVEQLISRMDRPFFGDVRSPIVHAQLKIQKPTIKDTKIEQKFDFWREVVYNRDISLSQDVSQKTVYVLDDLYQSGITLWSYAQYLKNMGAHAVIGIVCVKAGKDTDNAADKVDNSGDSWITDTPF